MRNSREYLESQISADNLARSDVQAHLRNLDNLTTTNIYSLASDLHAMRQDISMLKTTEVSRQIAIKFDQKITGIQHSLQFISMLGKQNGNESLEHIAEVGMQALQMFVGYKDLMLLKAAASTSAVATNQVAGSILATSSPALATLGPAATIATAALTIFSILSRRKKKQASDPFAESLMQSLKVISRQIYNLHVDMRELFDINFENQRKIFEAIFNGFAEISEKIDFMHLDLGNKIDTIKSNQTQLGKILVNGQEAIMLQEFNKLLNSVDARLEKVEKEDQKAKIEKLARKLSDWVKPNGLASSPLLTGINLLPAKSTSIDIYQWLNDMVFSNEFNAPENIFGLLADYAANYLNVELPERNFVSNPLIGIPATSKYIDLANQFVEYVDPDNINLNRFIESNSRMLTNVKSMQSTPDLWNALFKNYNEALNEIPAIINKAIATENKKINDEISVRNPGIMNITVDIAKGIEQFDGDWFNVTPKALIYGNGLPQIDYRSVMHHDVPLIKNVMRPLVVLERLGLAGFSMTYQLPCQYANGNTIIKLQFNIDVNISGSWVHLLTINRNCPVPGIVHADKISETISHVQYGMNNYESIIPDNIQYLHTQAISQINEFVMQHRKTAINNAILAISEVFQKLNATLNLLRYFAHLSGFRKEEFDYLDPKLSTIWDSNRILLHLQHYLNTTSIDTLLPQLAIQPGQSQEKILEKVNANQVDYFQSPVCAALHAVLIKLKCVEGIMQYRSAKALKYFNNSAVNLTVQNTINELTRLTEVVASQQAMIQQQKEMLEQQSHTMMTMMNLLMMQNPTIQAHARQSSSSPPVAVFIQQFGIRNNVSETNDANALQDLKQNSKLKI